jgi:hypothetical protein
MKIFGNGRMSYKNIELKSFIIYYNKMFSLGLKKRSQSKIVLGGKFKFFRRFVLIRTTSSR